MPRIAIVTDSTCCLTRQEACELGCTVLPMTYVALGERRQELPQGENGDYEAILRDDPFVGTESVYQRDFARAFEGLLDAGRDVLCVTMSARLSGAHRAAREAVATLGRERPGVDGRVQVVDSWATASGLELVVRQARTLADAGLSLAEVADGVREFCGCVGIRFAVPDMRLLRRSGRLGTTRRSVAGMLGRYPVFCLREGAIETVEVVRGGISAARALARPVPADVETVIVSHFGHADELAHVATCGSTNDLARRLYRSPGSLPVPADPGDDAGGRVGRSWRGNSRIPVCLVVADEQTQGRGRLGRSWKSGVDDSLIASFVLALPASLMRDSGVGLLTLAAGLAVLDAFRDVVGEAGAAAGAAAEGVAGTGQPLGLKWPNDVYLAGGKLAGILAEVAFSDADVVGVVVGVGANLLVAADRLPTSLSTSLHLHFDGLPPFAVLRDRLCADVARGLCRQTHALAFGGAAARDELVSRVNAENVLRGQAVTVDLAAGCRVEGVAGDVRADGSLEVLPVDGDGGPGGVTRLIPVTAGDVLLHGASGSGETVRRFAR